LSPARGINRQRTSNFDISSQTQVNTLGLHEGSSHDCNAQCFSYKIRFIIVFVLVFSKDLTPQAGSLIAEIYSWKSLSIGQPILRLHTTATKAALLVLPPG